MYIVVGIVKNCNTNSYFCIGWNPLNIENGAEVDISGIWQGASSSANYTNYKLASNSYNTFNIGYASNVYLFKNAIINTANISSGGTLSVLCGLVNTANISAYGEVTVFSGRNNRIGKCTWQCCNRFTDMAEVFILIRVGIVKNITYYAGACYNHPDVDLTCQSGYYQITVGTNYSIWGNPYKQFVTSRTLVNK